MSTSCNTNQMKQVLERHFPVCVTKSIWSPKMDLLLTANSQGQVSLQRHRSLQRVWQIVPQAEHKQVTGLAWRPDSNLIAVGYHTGMVLLVTLETGTEVHSFEVEEGVASLAWQQHSAVATTGHKDVWSDYMTPLPASDKWFSESSSADSGSDNSSWQSSHMLDNQDSLTILIVGTGAAKVKLYAFGLVHCATVDLTQAVADAGKVVDAQCSYDMNMLSVIVERNGCCSEEREKEERDKDTVRVAHVVCDVSVVAEHHKELHLLARKYAEIQSLFKYSTEAISHLREAWEGILLEMNTKLDAYSGMKAEGEVSADFLDLLLFGCSHPEFDTFLSNKLTEKGLKKLRQTVELSYTNMHKLVVKQLEAVGQGLVFVVSQVLGMARTTDRFGMLGVEEEVVTRSLKEAGAFLLKTAELQRVIALSMRDFLAFLKWLSAIQLRVNGSTVPPELTKTTQQETTHILSFLHDTFEEVVVDKDGKRHRKFRLEGVGQYLKDENLKSPQECDNNPWLQLLTAHPELHDHPLILPQRRNTSLIQEYSRLSQELQRMSERSVKVIGENIRVSKGVTLFTCSSKAEPIITQKSNPITQKLNVIIVPDKNSKIFYFYQWDTDINELYKQVTSSDEVTKLTMASFNFSSRDSLSSSDENSPDNTSSPDVTLEAAPIIAAHFYNADVASVLLQDFSNVMRSWFIQVPVSVLEMSLLNVKVPHVRSVAHWGGLEAVDLSQQVDAANVRRLDLSAGLFAVSGERKVAVVLANHRRTMVLYEMEVDEDEEEEEDGGEDEDDEEGKQEEADQSNFEES